MGWISEAGAVALGFAGLAFGWRERTSTLKHERTLADLEAVRSVIEDAAVHLHHVAYALDDVKLDPIGNASKAHAEIKNLGRRYDEISERMKVRMGPAHPATQHLVAANEAVLEIHKALGMILLEEPAEGAAARHGRIESLNIQRKRLITARDEFDQHRGRFIEAAARAAGAKLYRVQDYSSAASGARSRSASNASSRRAMSAPAPSISVP
jgi:hypothetical protein